MLKKKLGACEDAYFTGSNALGVADGVGCMVQFASYGINAAAYAAELMDHASAHFEKFRADNPDAAGVTKSIEDRAAAALAAAESNATTFGASTITVLALEGRSAGLANLGDSGFMLLRKGDRGMYVVTRSEEQQHSWNCPYQLTRLPDALLSKFPKLSLDTAADCEQYSFTVCAGDLILLFTDGLRDNLHDREILHIVDHALSPIFAELVGLSHHATPPDRVARAWALAAQERSLDPAAKVPFNEYSKRHGYECAGGKQDDITVVAAWVVQDDTRRQIVPNAADLPPPPATSAKRELLAEPNTNVSVLNGGTGSLGTESPKQALSSIAASETNKTNLCEEACGATPTMATEDPPVGPLSGDAASPAVADGEEACGATPTMATEVPTSTVAMDAKRPVPQQLIGRSALRLHIGTAIKTYDPPSRTAPETPPRKGRRAFQPLSSWKS